jgi:hypothetical protein
MRGRRNGETRWGALPAGSLGCLDCSSKSSNLGVACVVHLGRSTLAALLACLDYLPLTFPYVQASLQLLTHAGVLGVEARRQAGHADIVEVRTALARRSCSQGTGGVDDVVVG